MAIDGTHRAGWCTVSNMTNIDSLMINDLWSQQRQDAVCLRYKIVMSLCCYCYVSNSAVGF